MDTGDCGGKQVRHRVEVNAAQEWCQRLDCFWAGHQLSPSFGTQMQAHLYPSFLQPSTCYCNGLDTENKLWLCLCSRQVHWQNQLYTRQPITLQHTVWAQLHLAWVKSVLHTSRGRHTHQLCDHQKQPCSLTEGHDFAQSQHKVCQRIVPLVVSIDS
jgi:hypothetical protein